LTPAELRKWLDLADSSVEPNPFLSPDFVVPLARNLPPGSPLAVLAVESADGARWLAAGVFEIRSISRWLPLVYARGLSTDYSFLDGLLIAADGGDQALITLFEFQRHRRDWHGMHFSTMRHQSPLFAWLSESGARTNVWVDTVDRWERASFRNTGPLTINGVLESCSKSRRKSLRRGRRWLESAGSVTYELVQPGGDAREQVDTFLHLEKLGWKGEEGTALACHPAHERFFREMCAGFAQRGAILFGELRVGGKPIASTCNLRCGPLLSAFKIGWDPAFADGSVGIWSEVEFAVAISQQFPEIKRIDSCSSLGSYVESVWPEREPMVSVTCTWSNRGAARHLARKYLQKIRSFVSSRRTSPQPIPVAANSDE